MTDTATAPLANFLISRNKELEQQVAELKDECVSIDGTETSLRYTRGLLTNYVEFHKESEQLLDSIQDTHRRIRAHLWVGGWAIVVAVAVITTGPAFGLQTDTSLGSLITYTLAMAVIPAAAWTWVETTTEFQAAARSIKLHSEMVTRTKRSNHLFSDILDPLLSDEDN